MTDEIDDGGPAFPSPCEANGFTDSFNIICAPGMSLRDWFAGMALCGWVASTPSDCGAGDYKPLGTAEFAYKLADAMLAERKR